MFTRIGIFFALTLVVRGANDDYKGSDADIVAGLLGTWEAPVTRDSIEIESESSYTKDGVVAGFVMATAKYPDGTTKKVRVGVKARWTVKDGVMFVTDFETVPPGVVPSNRSEKYKILSLSADEVVFRALDDGSELYRRRKKANHVPDPASPTVTPPASAGGAPSVAADH